MLFRVPRRAPASGGHRKRMAVARLGGVRCRRFLGALRRVRVRCWLAALCRRTLRRLRASYAKALRELAEGMALLGALRPPAGVECSRAAAFGPVATVGL